MRLAAHAKINLYLDVVDRFPDGYHAIRSVMQSISLADAVKIELARKTGVVCPERPDICGVDNLAYRAFETFKARVGPEAAPEIRVEISKRIPVAAGLAGGSTDAAATLIGLNELSGAGLGATELVEMGASIGADVPFCLTGGTMLAEGKGDRLSNLPAMPEAEFVLVTPAFTLSTPQIYSTLDRLGMRPLGHIDAMLSALEVGTLDQIAAALDNRLQVAALYLCPEIEKVLNDLSSVGALGVSLSGSGPTVFGLFEVGRGEKAAEEMRSAFPDAFVGLALPSRRGIDIVDRH